MKKIFSIALMALFVLPAFAGKATPKNWNFALNDDGVCVVERTIDTDKDGAAALKAIKAGLNSQSFAVITLMSEEDGASLTYLLKKNTKSRYNPFAGMFQEFMEFKLNASYEAGKVKILINSLTLQNLYAGFGAKMESEAFEGKISAYNDAEQKAATGKGKEKKEALEKMEEINDSFNTCQEEMDKILQALQRQF